MFRVRQHFADAICGHIASVIGKDNVAIVALQFVGRRACVDPREDLCSYGGGQCAENLSAIVLFDLGVILQAQDSADSFGAAEGNKAFEILDAGQLAPFVEEKPYAAQVVVIEQV